MRFRKEGEASTIASTKERWSSALCRSVLGSIITARHSARNARAAGVLRYAVTPVLIPQSLRGIVGHAWAPAGGTNNITHSENCCGTNARRWSTSFYARGFMQPGCTSRQMPKSAHGTLGPQIHYQREQELKWRVAGQRTSTAIL